MRCPFCTGKDSKVTDSRMNDAGVRRRRECLECRRRFTTLERVQSGPLLVSKRDGRREEFSREKMIAGLRLACAKRPVTAAAIEGLVDDIETELQQRGGSEVTSDALGAAVMDRLRELDPVGYIRFASVYRQFQEIESFETAVRDLRDGNQQLPLLDNAPAPPRPGNRGRRRAASTSATPPAGSDGAAETGIDEPDPESEKLRGAVGTMGSDKE